MQIVDYDTFLFKNIFEDYDTFKTWYLDCGLSDDEEDVPAKKTFRLIANEFNDCHTCYSVESFKEHFANVLYTYYKEFEATTSAIDKLMSLSDSEAEVNSSFITNVADIPETTSDTNADVVDFISQQQKNIDMKGKSQVYREQISNKRAYTVKTFLNRFRALFIKIISPSYTRVYGESEDE